MVVAEDTNKMAPAARRGAPINFRHSVRDGVPLTDFAGLPQDAAATAASHAVDGRVRMWGSMENKDAEWERVRVGDAVLFYTGGHFAAVARVAGKRRDSQLADATWDPEPGSWRNILFLRDVRAIDVSVAAIAALLGYKPNWDGPREFFFPALDVQNRALGGYEDFEDFIASLTADSSLRAGLEAGESYADVVGRVESESDVEALLRRLKARNNGAIPASTKSTIQRIKRDAELVRQLKDLYDGHCQVCDDTFRTLAGTNYCEGAHVVPLERRLPGIDSYLNLVIVCATCHRKLDHGGMLIEWDGTTGEAVCEWQGVREPLVHNQHIHTGWSPAGS